MKLLSGKVERIDAYTQRMLQDKEVLKEVTLVKDYEYNQWARTKPISERDYNQANKPLPLDKIESRYTQPSWDTVRAMNSTTTLSTRHRLFSYEDLAAKFNEPKFLKRMGFGNKKVDTNLNGDEASKEKQRDTGQGFPAVKESGDSDAKATNDDEDDEIADDISDRLSSDDEEYYRDETDMQPELPPDRVPSSKRSSRQQLAIYKDDGIIGSKSVINRVNANKDLVPLDKSAELQTKEKKKAEIRKKPAVPISTLNMKQETTTNDEAPSKQKNAYTSKSVRKSKSYKLDISTSNNPRRFVPFSQPVCLCPKLSKETLASFYSPMMQHYFASAANNGYVKCKLHGPNGRDTEKAVLKSL